MEEEEQKTRDRVLLQVWLGNINDAMKVMKSLGVAPATEHTAQRLQALHPTRVLDKECENTWEKHLWQTAGQQWAARAWQLIIKDLKRP